MSAIAKVASMWNEDVGESRERAVYGARGHVSIDGRAAVPLSQTECELLRCALLYALVNVYGFARFAYPNSTTIPFEPNRLSAMLHGVSHIVEHGEPSPRDTLSVAAWRRRQPRRR
jgi:hypothetical protein